MTRLSHRELNRATLARQLLLSRERMAAPDAARRVVALQTQFPASSYVALWNRVEGFDAADLDAAYESGELIRSISVRIALHTLHRDDYAAFHSAMQPSLRGSRLHDDRFTSTGLTAEEADALVPGLLEFLARPHRGDEVEAWLEVQVPGPAGRVWWALRTYAPLRHVPTGPPWSFGTRSLFGAAASGYRRDPVRSDEDLVTLARRYLEGFGPASVADLAQFALVPRARARAALAALSDERDRFSGPDGTELFDVPGGARPPADTPAPARLLGMWDNILLAYSDRSRVIPASYRRQVTRTNGDVLPTLLVDGEVAGVWRAIEGRIEAMPFHELPRATWTELEAEAESLRIFLAPRDPDVYRRYHHWWDKLPAGETRVRAA